MSRTNTALVNEVIAARDLLVNATLVVVPDLPAGKGKDGSNAKEISHCGGLKDAALGIDEWNALALEEKTLSQVVGCDDIADAGALELLDGS